MKDQAKKEGRFPAANLAQWISAFTSTTTTCLAVWAIFFSSASQSLVQYLQSELSYRNTKILNLETQEQNLKLSIQSSQVVINNLEEKQRSLNAELAKLSSDRESLVAENNQLQEQQSKIQNNIESLKSQLTASYASLIKWKLVTEMKSKIVSTKLFSSIREVYSSNEPKSKNVSLWQDYVDFLQKAVARLPESDRSTGKRLLQDFPKKCGYLKSRVVIIPTIVQPEYPEEREGYYSLSDDERRKAHEEFAQKEKAFGESVEQLSDAILDEQKRIEDCFKSLS